MRNPVRGIDRRSPLAQRRGAPAGIARLIWGVIIGAYDAPTNSLSLSYNSNAQAGDIFRLVITPAADAFPNQAQVMTVQPGTGGTLLAAANFPFGATSFALPANIARQSARAHIVVDNGGTPSAVFTTAPFLIDTTPAVLSAISFANNAAGGISFSFNVNEAGLDGVSVRIAAWASGTNPTAARKTGIGAITSVIADVDAPGTISGTLACGAGVRQCTIWFSDDLGNETFYTHSPEITVTVAGLGRTFLGVFDSNSATNNITNVNLSSVPSGGKLIVGLCALNGQANNATSSLTVQGVPATMRVQSGQAGSPFIAEIYEVDLTSAGSATATLTIARPVETVRWHAGIWHVTGAVTARTTVSDTETLSAPLVLDINTGANGLVFAAAATEFPTAAPVWSGITLDGEDQGISSRWASFASATTTAQTPRAISCDTTPGSAANNVSGGAALALS